MNAVIALCQFCETDGPSVLFTTQAFHDSEDPQKALEEKQLSAEKKLYYGRPDIQRSVSTGSPSPDQKPSKKSNPCAACQPLPSDEMDFISNDHEAKVSYISSHFPHHPEIFSIVRQACVRSLNCEMCPGREGPVFFGDVHRGHVFSHTFILKDSHARGFQHLYSIIVVMMDKIFLLNSWPFLLKHFRSVIDELQEKASKVYDMEQAECPQRALRLNSLGSITLSKFRIQRGGFQPMRSLPDLTNDKEVFANLHLWFTWILKAGGNRLTEKLLEGPPTEDTVIDLEQQVETEEGFMLVTTKKVPKEYSRELESKSCSESEENFQSNQQRPRIENIRQLFKVLGADKLHVLAYHVILGNQVIVRGNNPGLVSSVINAIKVLLPKGCCRVISYAQEYQDSWKCNFLGVPLTAGLPEHVEKSDLHIQVDIVTDNENSASLGDYKFTLFSTAVLPEKCPTVLVRMETAIRDSILSEHVLECLFVSLKEEWMNKVKVLFKFSRGASRSTEETKKLLTYLGAQDFDKPVLKFWMTGLSSQYKTYALSAIMSQCHGNEGAI